MNKKSIMAGVIAIAMAVFAETPTVTDVVAKQRYPWNGKVDITYTLTGDVTAGLPAWNMPRLFVTASNRVDGTTYSAAAPALSGDMGTAEGSHHVVWDLNAQGLEIKSDEVVFTVGYQSYDQYCIIDLSSGASASSYPVSYLTDVPSGGFNTDEYKTTKLVLRLIEPGSFKMCRSYDVTLTKPFYCGIFEVTQRQWELVTGSNPCSSTSYGKGNGYPVHYVSYNMIRGSSAGAGWPGSTAVDGSSFLGKLQARTGIDFDLPTEAQWEYACRAGTTTTYSYGNSADGNYMWYFNSSSTSHVVGTKQPNAWGLYDMHGNVWEWCLDWYGSLSSGVTDPLGSSSGSGRVERGGGWENGADACTSSNRLYLNPSFGNRSHGFRLVRTLSNTEGARSPGPERADALCVAEAAPVAIDSRLDVEPVLDEVVLPWDASWIGGDVGATVVISDNGTEVKRTMGTGEFTYTLSGGGRHELTYTTYIDGVAQGEVYATTVYAPYGVVTFDANGGSVDEPNRIVNSGCAVGELPMPMLTGYAFVGWWTSANGGTRISASTTVKDNVTYHAHWTINSYTVTFDANGGTGGTSARQNYGTAIVAPTVTRTGYTFVGWLPAVVETVPDNDVSYTAQWQVNQYTVTFDANGGTDGTSVTQDYGTALAAPTVTRTGYTFTGWSPSVPATVPADNRTYTAQWRINSHTVTFDANGGTGGTSTRQNYGTAIVAPTVARTGYTFTGWSPAVADTVPDNDVTYTAQWQVNQYTVTFDANGGVGGMSVTQDYDTAVTAPDVRRENYMFTGWSPVFPGTMPAENTTYVAQWLCEWRCVTNADDTLTITGVNFTPVGVVVIPSEIDGCPVTGIGPGVFNGCNGLTSVMIPEGVVGLGDRCFDGCDSLTNVTFMSEETSLGNNDLRNVGRLFELRPNGYWVVQGTLVGFKGECPATIPDADSLVRVMPGALEGCTALTGLTFSAASMLTSIGTNAFKGCTELQSLVLPPSLEEIGDEAFMGCSYLDNVIVPGSVKRVGARAFKNCTGFTAAQIEHGVESIGNEAFYGDWQIAEVDVPSTVTNIGVNAFGGDSSIIRVGLRGDVRPVSEIFSNYQYIREATIKAGDRPIVDGLFTNCTQLLDVRFHGNCPSLANNGVNIYYGTRSGLTTYVEQASTGWDGTPGSHALPQAWPLSGSYRRSIAWWDVPTYRVQFDSNGGTLGVQEVEQRSEHLFVLPSEPTKDGQVFAGWWTRADGGMRVTAETVFVAGVYTTLYAHWVDDPNWKPSEVAAPTVTPGDGATFAEDSCTVTITCATEGAAIYYSTDGSTPRPSNRFRYTGPFTITDTTEICTFAVVDDVSSDFTTVTITKTVSGVLTLAGALDVVAQAVTTGGDADWMPVEDATAVGGSSARSGAIAPEESTWTEMTVSGAGTLSFSWKADCEKDPRNRYSYDFGAFAVDGNVTNRIDGTTPWQAVTVEIAEGGTHVFRWTYSKDDYDEDDYAGEDCIWVDHVVWTPSGDAGLAAWLAERNLTADTHAANGRTAAECYALGLDPADATNDFRIVSIELVDGEPKVEWEPKANRWTGAEIPAVLKGAETLDGEWKAVEGATAAEKAAMRFFKVVVEVQ